MFFTFYHAVFSTPLYNGLIFLVRYLPHGDVGLAIILFTILVRLILFPLSKRSLQNQKQMRELEPEMKKIKEEFKDNKEEQAKRTMALYKEKKLNPFSGILLVLIQIPIIIALYQVFLHGGLPAINTSLLYSFVKAPTEVSMIFLGFFDVAAKKNIILAILTGLTQYLQARFSLPPSVPKPKDGKPGNFQDEFTRGMSTQMKYVLPVFIAFITYGLSGAVGLYWVTNNLFTIGQEFWMRRK